MRSHPKLWLIERYQDCAAGIRCRCRGFGLSACHDADEEEEEEDDEEEEEADDDDGAGYVDGVAALSVVALRVSELGCPQTLALVHFAASAEDIVEDIGGLVANYNTPLHLQPLDPCYTQHLLP